MLGIVQLESSFVEMDLVGPSIQWKPATCLYHQGLMASWTALGGELPRSRETHLQANKTPSIQNTCHFTWVKENWCLQKMYYFSVTSYWGSFINLMENTKARISNSSDSDLSTPDMITSKGSKSLFLSLWDINICRKAS